MNDPVYRRQPGESKRDYEQRMAEQNPPEFAGKTEIGPVVRRDQGLKPHGPVKARRR
jgi:hypothetical protein